MARIIISREARKDLTAIKAYIGDELLNTDAAQRVIQEIKSSILSLETFPERGRPMSALIRLYTEYRYLVCENYCIFYISSDNEVQIIRVLHQRQDFLKALLNGH